MCQALRQRSIRAITKLTHYIHTFLVWMVIFYIFVHSIKSSSITNHFTFFKKEKKNFFLFRINSSYILRNISL